jgi:hypothetical protein
MSSKSIRKSALLILALLLVPSLALAAPAKKRKYADRRWHGYGFLPGYAPAEAYPAYKGRKVRVPRDILARKYPQPHDPPYGYYGPYQEYRRWGYYWYPTRTVWSLGGPGFYQNRYNGGGFGPCYTRTPIGPVWNCGM